MTESYVAVDDAANELGVSRATLWKWIKRNELPTFRFLGERKTFMQREDVAKLREPILIDPSKKAVA